MNDHETCVTGALQLQKETISFWLTLMTWKVKVRPGGADPTKKKSTKLNRSQPNVHTLFRGQTEVQFSNMGFIGPFRSPTEQVGPNS